MGRRRGNNKNILQDLLDIGGMLPWWLTMLLALGAYALLHQLAASEPAVVADPKDVLATVFPNVLRNVAVYAQYIVPWLLVVGMLSSALRRATRAQFFASEPERCAEGDRPEEPQPEELAWDDDRGFPIRARRH